MLQSLIICQKIGILLRKLLETRIIWPIVFLALFFESQDVA